jgi:hypothetical protein
VDLPIPVKKITEYFVSSISILNLNTIQINAKALRKKTEIGNSFFPSSYSGPKRQPTLFPSFTQWPNRGPAQKSPIVILPQPSCSVALRPLSIPAGIPAAEAPLGRG